MEPITIKKYANRRLYNTDTSSYVTLDDLAEMVRAERDFVVYDAKTGEDLTHAVLTQIIVEQESRGQNLLPIPFLRQLIRFYGHSIEKLVPSYLEYSLDSLNSQQDRYRKQFANSVGTATLEAIQQQTRQNLAMFDKALGMFNPFADTEASEQSKPANSDKPQAETNAGGGKDASDDDIASLKEQLSDMQEKLDRLSRR
jgi:polyhydroxyalkanoate synthesis repressor PhaR